MAEQKTTPTSEAPALPDVYTDPNAVLGDLSASWRYGKPPDYSKTRQAYEETKRMSHAPGTLPSLVENLVKNWEIEASFKTNLSDWRTINHSRYTFSMNGASPQTASHMLKVGTYNAIIPPNEFYSPEHSDFASSHKTFKRMMPFFAWEVLEVYSGPPKVAFRWRHWGEMKSDYVGFNNQGEKVTAKAHGGLIDIQGVTVADLDEEMKIVHIETWFDPMDMFRQIAPKGIVNKQPVNTRTDLVEKSDSESMAKYTVPAANEPTKASEYEPAGPLLPHEATLKTISMGDDNIESAAHEKGFLPVSNDIKIASEVGDAGVKPSEADANIEVAKSPTDEGVGQVDSVEAEAQIKPEEGEAVAASGGSVETVITHEEMSGMTPADCPFLNRE